ncbi:MAG: hypothetical protein ACRD2F_10825, partial [Terriglobales bacterium]
AGPPAASHHTCASHQYRGPYAAFFGRGRAGSPRSQTVAGRVALPPSFFSSLSSLRAGARCPDVVSSSPEECRCEISGC